MAVATLLDCAARISGAALRRGAGGRRGRRQWLRLDDVHEAVGGMRLQLLNHRLGQQRSQLVDGTLEALLALRIAPGARIFSSGQLTAAANTAGTQNTGCSSTPPSGFQPPGAFPVKPSACTKSRCPLGRRRVWLAFKQLFLDGRNTWVSVSLHRQRGIVTLHEIALSVKRRVAGRRPLV